MALDVALDRLASTPDALRGGGPQEDVTALAVEYHGGERSRISRW